MKSEKASGTGHRASGEVPVLAVESAEPGPAPGVVTLHLSKPVGQHIPAGTLVAMEAAPEVGRDELTEEQWWLVHSLFEYFDVALRKHGESWSHCLDTLSRAGKAGVVVADRLLWQCNRWFEPTGRRLKYATVGDFWTPAGVDGMEMLDETICRELLAGFCRRSVLWAQGKAGAARAKSQMANRKSHMAKRRDARADDVGC